MTNLALNYEEHSRSRLLTEKIVEEVRNSNNKGLPFSRYMDLVLYHPLYGYYTSATNVVGPGGDFVTAPEMGEIFGKILAMKIAENLSIFDGPNNLYEFGAGNGTLAVQLLRELERLEVGVSQYAIMEVSSTMRRTQQETIDHTGKQFGKYVNWCEQLPAHGLNGIVIANEVLDAMPIELFVMEDSQVLQGFVVESKDGFVLEFREDIQSDFKDSFATLNISEINAPYTSELHCQAEAWLRTIAQCLNAGSILIADYGFPEHEYYHRDRKQGTLVCHRRQQLLYDPFAYVGCQDITAHVNFSGLARVAKVSGMEVNGFTSLANFIVDVGMASGLLDGAKVNGHTSRSHELMKLCQPQEMGEIFKVIELTKNFDSSSMGFDFADRTHRLQFAESNCLLESDCNI